MKIPWRIVAAVSAGGGLGALARYGLGLAFPHSPHEFPWATLAINVVGCLLIGVLMALTAKVGTDQQLLRPFLGTGLLGGFTTFSTYAVDIHELLRAGETLSAFGYLFGTVIAALVAVQVGYRGAQAVTR